LLENLVLKFLTKPYLQPQNKPSTVTIVIEQNTTNNNASRKAINQPRKMKRLMSCFRSLNTISYPKDCHHTLHATPSLLNKGHGGQSFALTLAKGITMKIEGDANDYAGKGLLGGKIAVYPSPKVIADGFKSQDHVVVGNVCQYGATSGKAFFAGKAGERFCVRNSGALAVIEGLGDHGCEYMTGGQMICLEDTGRNFGAGMSGGIAYIYDPNGQFPAKCNMGLVGLESIESVEEAEEIKSYIQEHVDVSGSA
jgi:glutamate synthase domain-containing protein 3